MPKKTKENFLTKKLVIAISSRALFDLDDSHKIYEEEGIEAYSKHQIAHEDELLEPGAAYHLVKKLLALNTTLSVDSSLEQSVEVILLSRNSADTGLRIFNSIEQHDIDISRAAFTSGSSPYRYAPAFQADLFLSTNPEDVAQALEAGVAAATIIKPLNQADHQDQLRFAFDGDAVLFSDEAERVYQKSGLKAFTESEKNAAHHPLKGGPFKNFLASLHALQKEFPESCPIRTALVTARSAPTHERVIRTLRDWDIRIDEALFLGGLPKGEFLQAYGADVFFDDQQGHIDSARLHVASAHVPHGISNPNTEKIKTGSAR
ncbi:MAG: 5'-nucleotidase [Gammaproteobacteria bacterium]|nr:MAG: 5'-nucleotidase [Gammaproteobacteria bacterium]